MEVTKESVLKSLQDLVLTLKCSTNLKHTHVLQLWREKSSRLMVDIGNLSRDDYLWVSAEHDKWFLREISPIVPKDFPKDLLI